jgi:hypothetical protein
MPKERCINCVRTAFVDELSTVDNFVYRCEVTGEIIESVSAEVKCDKMQTKLKNAK